MNDPLTPEERDEHERDLIAFSDRELDLLGDIRGRNVLYAGGTSPLWIEGLAERIGKYGSLTVLDLDGEGISEARNLFDDGELPATPRFVVGDVFDPPFERGSFDLVYSSGLLHELDVSERDVGGALSALANALRSGGRLAMSDFVDDVEAAQIEDEAIEAELLHLATGAELFGVGDSTRILDILEGAFALYGHSLHPPFEIRHLDKLFLAEPEPAELDTLVPDDAKRIRHRRERLRERVKAEGYTRPATLFFDITHT
ncbi:MAG: class I SAM-dependent methyltransferase [Rubrobacter sp.]|nr:class I SAM-dependent methyltransferase [Rubrobacter sp.]